MKNLSLLLLLSLTGLSCKLGATENPDMTDIKWSSSTEVTKVIASVENEGTKWNLIRELSGDSGGLFLYKDNSTNSELIGGDSSPWPLSRYGVEDSIAFPLADQYVQHEIEQSGMDQVKEYVASMNKIPADLLQAYKKVFEVDALPEYGTANRNEQAMLRALNLVRNSQGELLQEAILKSLEPVMHPLIVKIADEPTPALGKEVLEATASHPELEALVTITAVYAARQTEHFKESYGNLNDQKKAKIIASLETSVRDRIVGSKVRTKLSQVIESLKS